MMYSEEDSTALQKDLDILSEWIKKWQMQLNISKCKLPCSGKKGENTSHRHDNIEANESACERDPGEMVSRDLNSRQQCKE